MFQFTSTKDQNVPQRPLDRLSTPIAFLTFKMLNVYVKDGKVAKRRNRLGQNSATDSPLYLEESKVKVTYEVK